VRALVRDYRSGVHRGGAIIATHLPSFDRVDPARRLRPAMNRLAAAPAFGLLIAAALAAFAIALSVGSVALDLTAVARALLGGADATPTMIVRDLRLPRAIAAFATGGSLALAGALLQVLLRNPLADPYVLGVSGGAAVGALLTILVGAAAWMTPLGAFGGAFASTVMVFALSRGDGAWSPTRLLLTGVIVAAGWAALVALLLTLAPDAQLRGMLFWLIGDLSSPPIAWIALAMLVLGLSVALPFARDLNALARGNFAAAALGVAVTRLPWLLFGLSAALTAVAVTTAGAIGFVGLIVPHAVRLLLGSDQRVILPACGGGGGARVLIAATL